jgi:hypothetical protein
VSLIGLALLPQLIRVQDVFATQLVPPDGTTLATDDEIRTTCPTCHAEQTLGEAGITRIEAETVYTCKNGCQRIVVVGQPGKIAWPGRGYRLGPYTIRNANDLFVPVGVLPGGVRLPASRQALM